MQFKTHEKHPQWSVTFSKVAGNSTKSSTPLCVFFCNGHFSNCTNGIKSHKASHMMKCFGKNC